jgi:hypothetical protein
MAYFRQMGAVWVTPSTGGENILINDITAFSDFSDVWKFDVRTQLQYTIRDGELPHTISNKLYDTVDYWWSILKINKIYDFDNQWPRNQDQLNKYIAVKYPGKLSSDIHHYTNTNGLVVDMISLRISTGLVLDADIINQLNLNVITIDDFESTLNEAKRQISLVDPDFIHIVQSEYDKAMQSVGV